MSKIRRLSRQRVQLAGLVAVKLGIVNQSAEQRHLSEDTMTPIRLDFEQGTLCLRGSPEQLAELAAKVAVMRLDERAGPDGAHRAPAAAYREIVETLMALGWPFADAAKGWERTVWSARFDRDALPHQSEALTAWWAAGGRGVVVLPTGTGKTWTAVLAIRKANRPTLVVVPTLDLMRQWFAELELALHGEVGLIGGGHHEPRPLCVTTYDSAYLHMDRLGNRWGLVIYDECHHLPGPSLFQAALCTMAPFRLGLTATPERADGRHAMFDELIGPLVYRRGIAEMAGQRLAEYRVERLYAELSPSERREYDAARAVYREFVDGHGLRVSQPRDWSRFVMLCSRSAEGRAAWAAFRRQKDLATAAPAKMVLLQGLLARHAADRALVFARDNATVYHVSREFLLPAITHQTKIRERKEILDGFAVGRYPAIVTAQVLNEGINIPEANTAIILSGTGSVREHVQRLGRILRHQEGKQAVLYELVTRGTSEEDVSDRRRQHEAYQ